MLSTHPHYLILFASSNEIGGLLFSVLAFLNLAACFVAAKLYLKYSPEGGEIEEFDPITNTTFTTLTATKFKPTEIWPVLVGILVLFVLSAVAFLCLIDKKYFHTFISTLTGPENCAKQYREATMDEQRMDCFRVHPTYRYGFDDDLRNLVTENWNSWMDVKPDWFTDDVISNVGDDYLPVIEVDRLKIEGGGKRRKSSVMGLALGGV